MLAVTITEDRLYAYLSRLRRGSRSPEIPKTHRRQFRVAHRVLDVAVAEISLQGSGVVPLIGEPVIASAATEAARTSRRSISANTEATSGYPARPSQRLPHPP